VPKPCWLSAPEAFGSPPPTVSLLSQRSCGSVVVERKPFQLTAYFRKRVGAGPFSRGCRPACRFLNMDISLRVASWPLGFSRCFPLVTSRMGAQPRNMICFRPRAIPSSTRIEQATTSSDAYQVLAFLFCGRADLTEVVLAILGCERPRCGIDCSDNCSPAQIVPSHCTGRAQTVARCSYPTLS
jgi:hypothetical protein